MRCRFLTALALSALATCASLAGESGSASVEVTFNAALTNETAWTFNEKIKYTTKGEYYINAKDALVTAPQFDFAVTSVLVNVKLSSSTCDRNLILTPVVEGNPAPDYAIVFDSTGSELNTSVFANWDPGLAIRSFVMTSTTGTKGNLYILSATISGVPLVSSPTGVEVSGVRSGGFSISWINPDAAVSNRIDVSQVVEGREGIEYDFHELSNSSGNPKEVTENFIERFPEFDGSSLVYLPANSEGVIQISNDDNKGYLVRSGFEDTEGLMLTVSACRPNSSQGEKLGIGYEGADGTTNVLASIDMTTDFQTNTVSLAGLPSDTPIIFNTEGTKTKRRVEIDYLAFNWCAKTNTVKSVFATESPARINGLSPSSDYVVSVTAFDSSDIESRPSDPVEARTADADPGFMVVVQ